MTSVSKYCPVICFQWRIFIVLASYVLTWINRHPARDYELERKNETLIGNRLVIMKKLKIINLIIVRLSRCRFIFRFRGLMAFWCEWAIEEIAKDKVSNNQYQTEVSWRWWWETTENDLFWASASTPISVEGQTLRYVSSGGHSLAKSSTDKIVILDVCIRLLGEVTKLQTYSGWHSDVEQVSGVT